MLETLLRLYVMSMAGDVRSPLPHLFGPPGCGKSSSVEKLAELVGKKLHTINVSRISPLELEGVQMPHTHEDELKLKMLTATWWTALEDGDIVLLDEFLRGFPEVYNGLLDILTSRTVGDFVLPKVFIIAASNSTTTYDKALEDRLLHLPVPDPRRSKAAKAALGKMIVEELGLLPAMAESMEMGTLLDTEVLPMFDVLDQIKGKGSSNPQGLKGQSVRKLIGQAQLRQVQSAALKELISMNNNRAMFTGKPQFVLLLDGKNLAYKSDALALVDNPKLTAKQALNINLNLQLIEMEEIRIDKKGLDDDDDDVFLNLD